MKPFRAKHQALRALAAREATMSADSRPQAPTPEQVAQVNAMRLAQATAARMQARISLAGIILNGICSGAYGRYFGWSVGRRAVRSAVRLADQLLEELEKSQQLQPSPPKATNGAG